ncbi:acid phosphatase [Aspergillus sp. HF37]|nr:acid phosphatase [Aspergillus sp. HF37]
MLLSLLWLFPLVHAINIISSNDDGWAVANIRSLYHSLTSAGHSVVISAPAHDQSGTGSLDDEPSELDMPCQFNSCPAGSPPTGHSASQPRFNYVNSYPATAMKWGINTFGPKFFGGPPDLAVAGPNVGSNLGLAVFFSGTVGAATLAAHEAGLPAIAFSGRSGSATAWNAPTPHYSPVYAELSTRLVNRLIASGPPYLPPDVWLNVNFPEVDDTCTSPDDFHFVLSRLFPAAPLITEDDVRICGSDQLPSEREVIYASGCYTSVSVGMADTKDVANATMQKAVLNKLGPESLSCLSGD